MIVFVDTSAFIALLDEDDARHAEAARLFRWLAANSDLVTHNYVQVETIALARRRLGVGAVQRLTDRLFPIVRTVWVDQASHVAALELHRATGSSSLVDHVSFLLMRQRGLDVAFAFDPDFQSNGFLQPAVPEISQPSRVSESQAVYDSPTADNLVSVTEIAARAGRSVNTVQSWRRRHRDFPAPTAQLAAGPIWNWPVVSAWISNRPARADASGAQAAADRGQIRRLLAMSDREREAYFLVSNRNMLDLFADAPAGR